jgi:hypothetical protein
MGENFNKVKVGEWFSLDGDKYKKTGPLTFDDMTGIERYIDPLYDRRINKQSNAFVVDTSAKVVKTEASLEPEVKSPKKSKKKAAKKSAKKKG